MACGSPPCCRLWTGGSGSASRELQGLRGYGRSGVPAATTARSGPVDDRGSSSRAVRARRDDPQASGEGDAGGGEDQPGPSSRTKSGDLTDAAAAPCLDRGRPLHHLRSPHHQAAWPCWNLRRPRRRVLQRETPPSGVIANASCTPKRRPRARAWGGRRWTSCGTGPGGPVAQAGDGTMPPRSSSASPAAGGGFGATWPPPRKAVPPPSAWRATPLHNRSTSSAEIVCT